MFLCSKASSGFPLHFELIKSLQDPQTLAPLPHLLNLLFTLPPCPCPLCFNHTHCLTVCKDAASGRLHRLFHSLFQGVLPQAPPSHTSLRPLLNALLSPCVTSLPLSPITFALVALFCHLIQCIFFYSVLVFLQFVPGCILTPNPGPGTK